MDPSTQIVLDINRHSNWANQQLIEAATKLSSDELHTPIGEGSIGDLFDTLVHIYGAQKLWYDRAVTGTSETEVTAADFENIAALATAMHELDAAQETFLTGRSGDELAKTIRLRFGSEYEDIKLIDMLLQQALHAQQHRGEVALILSQLGHSPGDLDFIEYVDTVRDKQ